MVPLDKNGAHGATENSGSRESSPIRGAGSSRRLSSPGAWGSDPAKVRGAHAHRGVTVQARVGADGGRLLAVLPGLGDVPRVRVFCDHPAHLAVTVGGEEGPRLDKEAKTVVKGVAFLRPILREEAVAQRVIAHNVLDL